MAMHWRIYEGIPQCRVAFLVCGNFCGESGVRKLGLGGIHPLTQRYVS
ncbi:DUF3265 domain-containing protein [Vibrio vulnificus]